MRLTAGPDRFRKYRIGVMMKTLQQPIVYLPHTFLYQAVSLPDDSVRSQEFWIDLMFQKSCMESAACDSGSSVFCCSDVKNFHQRIPRFRKEEILSAILMVWKFCFTEKLSYCETKILGRKNGNFIVSSVRKPLKVVTAVLKECSCKSSAGLLSFCISSP